MSTSLADLGGGAVRPLHLHEARHEISSRDEDPDPNLGIGFRLTAAPATASMRSAGVGPSPEHTTEMTDLNRRFAAGQPDAIREMYGTYARSVFAVSYRILGDSGLAEDAVQQTFLQAWRAAASFDGARDLAPWLHTIARRAAIDVYRRERRHRAERVEEDSVTTLPPSIETTWAVWEVRQALDELPPSERAVLHATHFQGLTHEEAAARLEIPVGTVKSRSYRAYRRLAGLLAHVEEVTR